MKRHKVLRKDFFLHIGSHHLLDPGARRQARSKSQVEVHHSGCRDWLVSLQLILSQCTCCLPPYHVWSDTLHSFANHDSLTLLLAQPLLNQSTQRRRVLPDAHHLVPQFILPISSLIAFPLRPAWPPSLNSLLFLADIVPDKLLSFTGQRKLAACLKLGPTV